ncbi:MAG: SRPBCC domain-containing protein [Methanoregula sp.]|nr:SRPBCC domain-containing protein [Methanoregula sp.]
MQKITGSKKYQNGVQVFWTDAGEDLNDFFSYEDLVEQKINALDVLNNPRLYMMNAAGHRIESAAAGCNFASKTCEDEILITRFFDAPREFIWRAWTEPELVRMWWGPKNFTAPSCAINLRVGGSYLYDMRSPEGKDYWSTGVFREIKRPERLVYTDSFSDENGKVVPATFYGMSADLPREMLVTVTFDELAGRTQLTLRHAGIPPGEMQDQTREGWLESLDKFAGIVARNVFRGKRSVRDVSGEGKA